MIAHHPDCDRFRGTSGCGGSVGLPPSMTLSVRMFGGRCGGVHTQGGLSSLRDQRNIRRDRRDFSRDRMLVVGHSLGGNMLITGLAPLVKRSIDLQVPGRTMHPQLGDLTVLINPAAEGSKWVAFQDAIHARDQTFGLIDSDGVRRAPLFRRDQLPVVVSLTSACGYCLGNDAYQITDDERDRATHSAFPLYKLTLGQSSAQERNTIGHMPLTNSRSPNASPGARVGPSHQLDVNQATFVRTTLPNVLDPNLSRCEIVDGWLNAAGRRAPRSFGTLCDAGATLERPRPEEVPNVTPVNSAYVNKTQKPAAVRRLETQFLQGFSRRAPAETRNGRPVGSGYDPFWNVKAHTGAISGHNGFVSYQTWCAMNQPVLDDITRETKVQHHH